MELMCSAEVRMSKLGQRSWNIHSELHAAPHPHTAQTEYIWCREWLYILNIIYTIFLGNSHKDTILSIQLNNLIYFKGKTLSSSDNGNNNNGNVFYDIYLNVSYVTYLHFGYLNIYLRYFLYIYLMYSCRGNPTLWDVFLIVSVV